jgi:hypothetical protein
MLMYERTEELDALIMDIAREGGTVGDGAASVSAG